MRAVMLVMFGVLCGSACGYADPLSQSRYGGVLALNGDEALAMDQAEKLMQAHCGRDNYEVTLIEEVVVDEEDYVRTESDADDGDDDDADTIETRAGTDELVETHVSYRCLRPVAPHL